MRLRIFAPAVAHRLIRGLAIVTVFTAVSHAQFPPPDFAVSGDPELEKIQTELYRGIREGRVDAVERFVKLGGYLNF